LFKILCCSVSVLANFGPLRKTIRIVFHRAKTRRTQKLIISFLLPLGSHDTEGLLEPILKPLLVCWNQRSSYNSRLHSAKNLPFPLFAKEGLESGEGISPFEKGGQRGI
jgi:hypothetical protein